MAVASGPPGVAYVGWLADNSPQGFAQYLRPFSVHAGWLAKPIAVSRRFGNSQIWPGDTIGISLLPVTGHGPQRIQLSWGSAVSGPDSEIFGATVTP